MYAAMRSFKCCLILLITSSPSENIPHSIHFRSNRISNEYNNLVGIPWYVPSTTDSAKPSQPLHPHILLKQRNPWLWILMMIRCLFDGDGVGEDALSTVDDDRGPEIHHKWILLPLLNQTFSAPIYSLISCWSNRMLGHGCWWCSVVYWWWWRRGVCCYLILFNSIAECFVRGVCSVSFILRLAIVPSQKPGEFIDNRTSYVGNG